VHELDNPIWAALTTRHREFAKGNGDGRALRYPREVAPFIAVSTGDAGLPVDISSLVEPGELFYLVGPAPALPDLFKVEQRAVIVQMIWTGGLAPAAQLPVKVLSERDTPAMMELTSLVFPGFFRQRTPQMGRYLGIFDGETLVALSGERMRMEKHQEISAVCTRPNYTGRGYARGLVLQLVNEILQRGDTPFLHVGENNTHARLIYDRMGFTVRAQLPMLVVRRQ
jgi:ribosomal protein S18 acetylase RimI-like enzyme